VSNALLKLRWILLYGVSRAGLLLPRRLIPTRLAYAVAVRVADLCYLCFRGPRNKLASNLTRVIGDRTAAEKAARTAFRQYARYIIDLFQLPALGPAAVPNTVAMAAFSDRVAFGISKDRRWAQLRHSNQTSPAPLSRVPTRTISENPPQPTGQGTISPAM